MLAKSTFLSVAIASLACIAGTTAQISGLPTCTNGCLTDTNVLSTFAASGCQISNVSCICNSSPLIAALQACVSSTTRTGACNQSDQQAASTTFASACARYISTTISASASLTKTATSTLVSTSTSVSITTSSSIVSTSVTTGPVVTSSSTVLSTTTLNRTSTSASGAITSPVISPTSVTTITTTGTNGSTYAFTSTMSVPVITTSAIGGAGKIMTGAGALVAGAVAVFAGL